MRSLLNLLILVFVAGSIFYLVKKNDIDVNALVNRYTKDSTSLMQGLLEDLPGKLSELAGSFSPTLTPNSPAQHVPLAENNLGEVSPISLPDAIKKIGTEVKKVTTSPNTTVPGTAKRGNTVAPSPAPSTTGNTTTSVSLLTVEGTIANTNLERTKHSFKVLSESSKLNASAKVKADDILALQYFEHISPTGKSVSDLVEAQNYEYIKIGENLALGIFANDKAVVDAWMASPGHRANILDAGFSEIGVGISYGMYDGHMSYVAVQHFGRPSSECPEASSALRSQILTKQKEQNTLYESLQALKTQIDQGRAQGQNVNNLIDQYNDGVMKYETLSAQIVALIETYNNQVNEFNDCIHSPS